MVNKGLILAVGFVVLVSVVLVSAFPLDTSRSYGTISLHEGWNLVYGLMFPEQLQQPSQPSNIVVIFGYNPVTNSYFQTYPNLEEDKTNPLDSDEIGNLVFFVYSKKDMQIDYYALEEMQEISYDQRPIYAGWNFVALTPEMFYEKNGQDVFSWNVVRGSCSFEKIYAWNPEQQDWMSPISPGLESFDFNDFIGSGMVVKVTEDCNLGASRSLIVPPALPEDSTDVSEDNSNELFILEDIGNLDYRQNHKSNVQNQPYSEQYTVSYYLGAGDEYADAVVTVFDSLSEAENFFENEILNSDELEENDCNFIESDKFSLTTYELTCATGIPDWQQISYWRAKNVILAVAEPKSEGGIVFEAYFDKYL